MSLYPAKTRVQLLRDIANGQVLTDITAEPEDGDVILLFPYAPTEWQTRYKATSRVRELEREGWVEEDDAGVNWRLTDAGHAIAYPKAAQP